MSKMEQKRRRTIDGIVTTAAEMFATRGYAGTTVEAIADDVGVSAGTVYNYFGTKAAILGVVVGADFVEAFEGARSSLVIEGAEPVDVFVGLLEPLAATMFAYGRDLVREVFRSAYEPQRSAGTDDLVGMDLRMIGELADVISSMQDAGSITADADPGAAAVLVYSALAMAALVYLSVEAVTPESVRVQMRSQLELIVTGLAAR